MNENLCQQPNTKDLALPHRYVLTIHRPIVKMEGRGRRHCKSRKLMVTASCSAFLFSIPQISAPLLSGLHLSDDTYKHNWLSPAAFLWTVFCCRLFIL